MNILITGASGSLGKSLAQYILKHRKDLNLTLTGRRSNSFFPQEVRYIVGDLSSIEFCKSISQNQDVIIHCAARTAPWGKYEDFFRDNVLATQNIATVASKLPHILFIHISTPSIYYSQSHRKNISEAEVLPLPLTYYADTKIQAENIIKNLTNENHLRSIILRPRAIFGPHDQVLLPRILRMMDKGIFPLIDGGRAIIDLTYVDNLISCILKIIELPKIKFGEAYNITNDEPWTVLNILNILKQNREEMTHKKVRYIPIRTQTAKKIAHFLESLYKNLNIKQEPPITSYGIGLLSFDCTLDITKAKSELGYKATINMDQGLQLTFEEYRKMKYAK